jgi:tRNA C32,U32 (ribose-2'-O)-methylase TrmJ
MRRKKELTAEEVCARARRVAVLEDIVNPTNVGAIFRSAAGLGMEGVLLTPACSDPLYRRCVRVSMGTVFQVPWARIGTEVEDWPHPGLERLHALGFKTVAMALTDDALAIDDPRLLREERLAIVLGTEGDGLKKETIADCDYAAKIPMTNGVDSLNVAAASAVGFWVLSGNRQQGSGNRQQYSVRNAALFVSCETKSAAFCILRMEPPSVKGAKERAYQPLLRFIDPCSLSPVALSTEYCSPFSRHIPDRLGIDWSRRREAGRWTGSICCPVISARRSCCRAD